MEKHLQKVCALSREHANEKWMHLILKTMFTDCSTDITTFTDVIKHIQSIPTSQRALIPNITLCRTYCTLLISCPATTTTAEGSFSLGRRLKTWNWSTMKPDIFVDLAVMQEDKKATDNIDLVKIGNGFVSIRADRYITCGKFVNSDL